MSLCKVSSIRLCCLIVLIGLTVTLDACGLHRTVLLEKERLERLGPQKQREKALAEITEREHHALAVQIAIKTGERIPHIYGQALLQGTWVGSACNGRVAIEINLATANHEAPFSRYVEPADVVGTFRAVNQSAQSQPRVIETGLKGAFNYHEGVLSMGASPRPVIPTNEEMEEEYRQRDSAAVDIKLLSDELIYGSRGPWGIENEELVNKNKQALEEIETREALRRKAAAEEYEAKVAATKAELVPFQFDLARDSEGKGWAGTIDGPHFKMCEIRLVSKQGITTGKLPAVANQTIASQAIISQVALQRARNQN